MGILISTDSLSGNSLTVLICCIRPDFHSIVATSTALQFAANARALKTKVLPATFKTPFKAPPPTPSGSFRTPFRTPLVPILKSSNKTKAVVTPRGSTFVLPSKRAVCDMSKQFDDLEESIIVSSSYDIARSKAPDAAAAMVKPDKENMEDRIQAAVMRRWDAFLDECRERFNQTILLASNCPPSILESTRATVRNKGKTFREPKDSNAGSIKAIFLLQILKLGLVKH